MRAFACSTGRALRSASILALLVTFAAPLAGHAQDPDEITWITAVPYSEPAALLARLRSGNINSSGAIISAFEKDRLINDSTLYKGNYDRYTDAQRRELLDGVERIARGVEGERWIADHAEIGAFTVLSAVARDPEFREAYEIPDRLLRIYEFAKNDDAKRTSVQALGSVLRSSPAASPRIIKLLVSLVNQPVITRQQGYHGTIQTVDGPVHPDDALDALLSACEAGVPALRQLQANRGAIEHDVVRARVDSLASQGFAPGRTRLSSTGMNPCTSGQPTR